MGKLLKENTSFVAAIVFYLAGIAAYSCYEFYDAKNLSLKAIDNRLLTAVGFTEHLLQQKLRDNLVGQKPLTPDEDYILALELQELAEKIPVTYIYSLVQRDNDILFISSNPEPKELGNENSDKYKYVFLTPYEDAPTEVYKAFSSGHKQFGQYEDNWGAFRSVFFPLLDLSGETYVIGVDINISDLTEAAYYNLLKSLIYGLFLGVIAFPLVCLYLRTIGRQYKAKLAALHLHPVTGLPNKRRLEKLFADVGEEGADQYQLLVIEVENFSQIANVIGVAATDRLMVQLSFCLKELDIEGIEYCQIFHLEDDQFAICSNHDFTDEQIKNIISSAFHSMTKGRQYIDGEEKVPLIVRMGAVNHQSNPLMLAGMSLLHAKETNQSLVVYEDSLNLPHHCRQYINIFNLFSDALKHNRVKVFFQPILDVTTGQIVKYEALARILDEKGEIVSSPDEFMPIAYQSRLCHKLTRVMLDKVIEAIKGTNHIVSINLSVKDLFDKNTRTHIIHRIRETNSGGQIEFELLEQQVITNYHLAAVYIKQLKSCVSYIGMDDLGKLYSNFDRLLGLPLDFVKIDGMVVEAMERDSDAKTIIEGIVSFARQKGIHVVAEHCYSQSICDMMVLMNVDLLQGFHIGVPVDNFAVSHAESVAELKVI